MTSWLTTILIFLPMPARSSSGCCRCSRYWAGSLATLVSLVEVGFWILALSKFDFAPPTLQLSSSTPGSRDLGVSYHVGQFGFSLWLVGLTRSSARRRSRTPGGPGGSARGRTSG